MAPRLKNPPASERPRLFLIDGSSYIFRAFYAVPPACNGAGLPTSAVFGFTNLVVKLLRQYKPEYIAVALDASRETFRKQMFAGYKGNRSAPPADLLLQLPYIRRVLKGLNLPLLEQPGYEADDIIATLCAAHCREELDLVIVSPDKDLLQLVRDGVRRYDSGRQRWMGVAEVETQFGVLPEKMIQVMALAGDPVDNIPGVKGIGEKTALALIRRFHTLEELYDRLNEVEASGLRSAARVRRMLENGKDIAFLSRALATVKRAVPLAIGLDDLRFTGFDRPTLRGLFAELEFTSLITLLDNDRL